MDISKKEQTQTAGDNSLQNQFGNLNNCNVTINDKELIRAIATEVCSKEMLNVYRTCTQDAIELANKRDNMFAQIFIPRIEQIESSIKALKEPSFQFMIQDARETAAKTDRKEDWELLSELLICHIEKGQNKTIDAGVNRAIKIVNEIDIDALCALTVVCSLLHVGPVDGDIRVGLSALNNLYDSLLHINLPEGYGWIDQLSILGAINVLTGDFYKLGKLLSLRYDGYICVGIKKDSEEHENALKTLNAKGYSTEVLIENECMPDYLRLRIARTSTLKDELKPLLDLYTKDKKLEETAIANFVEIWSTYNNLKTVKDWFENIPAYFTVNSVGKALAQTNAKRCHPSFPDLI